MGRRWTSCGRRRKPRRRGPSRRRGGSRDRYRDGPPAKGHVLFETGYGPSGLPHIGTFGEVARTTMVRRAFETVSDIPTRLICFSDDLDGLRKVPENVPNQEMLRGEPAAAADQRPRSVRRLRELRRAQQRDAAAVPRHLRLRVRVRQRDRVLSLGAVRRGAAARAERYDAIMEVMLASLREERQQTYSIFLPISPQTGPRALRADEGGGRRRAAPSPSTTRTAPRRRCRSPAAT